MLKTLRGMTLFLITALSSITCLAAENVSLDWTQQPIADWVLGIFAMAYLLVIAEEKIALKKSIPVLVAACVIWMLLAGQAAHSDQADTVISAFQHYLGEYAELLLFLIVAMTFIHVMEERLVFDALRGWLVSRGLSYRGLFWVSGLLAFFISPIADNMTTALLMGAVVMAVGGKQPTFVLLACINLVVAANAGGAFSPFGDITTLMVWQKKIQANNGFVGFNTFFYLLIPALINWLVPAVCMHFALPKTKPSANRMSQPLKRGALGVIALFLITIASAVIVHSGLEMPPVLGMLFGFGLLMLFAYYLQHTGEFVGSPSSQQSYTVFPQFAKLEWDTLLFFYGVMLCVGGLGLMGYLSMLSISLYDGLGATTANIMIGGISAVIDNIPVMFAVLNMSPDMSVGQWLLVTMTAGVGGSLLSIGSAAGVALMGQAYGHYTFIGHLRWLPAIALGYAASIFTHLHLNHALF